MTNPLNWLRPLAAGVAVALAVSIAAPPARADDRAATIHRVQDYLNGFQSFTARFAQYAPDGTVSDGRLSLQRPGRVRFDYDPPAKLLIVADGRDVTVVDLKLGQVSKYPIGETPLKFLLNRAVDLERDTKIVAVDRRSDVLRVTMVDGRKPDQGKITLVFDDMKGQPLLLRSWEVIDAQGLQTIVALSDQTPNAKLTADLFVYKDPRLLTGGAKRP